MQTVELTDIKWEPSIYPRSKWNTATVERYADAMLAGDEFPPIVVEKGTNRLLDGKHRLEAYKKAGIEAVPVSETTVPEGVPIKLFAASLSSRHGDRIANSELKAVVREAWGSLEETGAGKQVAKLLGISKSTVSNYVSDLLAKRREERLAKALRLSMLGWTQEETSERLGWARASVSENVGKFNNELSDILSSGHTTEEIALRLGLPVVLVKALQIKGLDDKARLDSLGIKIQPYDVWNFSQVHDLMGDQHPGRIPGQLVAHALWYWTKPGDLVVDPMAGSGTTLDACLLMGRKCRSYDIDERHDRVDIEQHDLSNGWPEKASKADLIFWDPPYFDKMDSSTIGSDGYIEGSISSLSPDEYMDWISKRLSELNKTAKDGARIAFLMSDWDPENAKRHADHPGIFVWNYAKALLENGWNIERHIQAPLSTQQVHPDIVNKFRESRRMARLGRYLLVGRKA